MSNELVTTPRSAPGSAARAHADYICGKGAATGPRTILGMYLECLDRGGRPPCGPTDDAERLRLEAHAERLRESTPAIAQIEAVALESLRLEVPREMLADGPDLAAMDGDAPPELPEGWSWLSDERSVAMGPDDQRAWIHAKEWRGKVPHVEFMPGDRAAAPVAVVEAVIAQWRKRADR